MTRTTTHTALAGSGAGEARTRSCVAPVCLIARGDDPMTLRSRAARAGGDS